MFNIIPTALDAIQFEGKLDILFTLIGLSIGFWQIRRLTKIDKKKVFDELTKSINDKAEKTDLTKLKTEMDSSIKLLEERNNADHTQLRQETLTLIRTVNEKLEIIIGFMTPNTNKRGR